MYFLLTLIEGLITGVLTIMLMRFYLAIRVGSLWLLSYLSVFSLVSLSATILLKTNFLELFISEGGWAGLLAGLILFGILLAWVQSLQLKSNFDTNIHLQYEQQQLGAITTTGFILMQIINSFLIFTGVMVFTNT